jgi:hypothetical protein
MSHLTVQVYINVFLFLLLLVSAVISFISWFRSKGESVQASVVMGVAKFPVFWPQTDETSFEYLMVWGHYRRVL